MTEIGVIRREKESRAHYPDPGPALDAFVVRSLWRGIVVYDTATAAIRMIDPHRQQVAIPAYSTDKDAANRVVRQMRTRGLLLRVRRMAGTGMVHACFCREGEVNGGRYSRAPTLAMAICLAALAQLDGSDRELN